MFFWTTFAPAATDWSALATLGLVRVSVGVTSGDPVVRSSLSSAMV